jgi:hypothetical protein
MSEIYNETPYNFIGAARIWDEIITIDGEDGCVENVKDTGWYDEYSIYLIERSSDKEYVYATEKPHEAWEKMKAVVAYFEGRGSDDVDLRVAEQELGLKTMSPEEVAKAWARWALSRLDEPTLSEVMAEFETGQQVGLTKDAADARSAADKTVEMVCKAQPQR